MERASTFMDRVRATMKSAETEGPFELYVTRTPGYVWAVFFRRAGVHPVAVTLLSIVLGGTAGCCFGSPELHWNLIGMGLLVWADWLDCADGQLARMTGQKSLLGRVLDGFAGDVWFFSIYFFLCLRLWPVWGVWSWLLAAWAGLRCHARQCALADYYRNIHLHFLCGGQSAELDRSDRLYAQMHSLGWNRREWFRKLWLYFYACYTRRQEHMTPAYQRLFRLSVFRDGSLPPAAVERFLSTSRGLMKYCNILTFDTRAGVLFASLAAGVPWFFFVFECTVLEVLKVYVRARHEQACRTLYLDLRDHGL